jgi:DNA-binding transcriptional LysR family regulator
VALELGPRVPPCSIAVVWQRDPHQTPAARAFVETAQEVCAELAQTFLVAEAAAR